MGKTAIKVDDVSIRFNLSRERTDSLKEYVIKFLKREIKYDEFWALRNISFELKKGERLGILGLNGAGKSTLLKIIAGVYKPSDGTVERHGKIAPLLELGAGFDMQYTGAENIFLYGSVLGMSKEFLESKFDEIVAFSELEKFIDVPLKNYSSGMRARLGFSIVTVVDPDILILDEVLSVGDAKFRKKSEQRVMDMFDKGVTVLFVSHSLEQVERLCNKAMILEDGQMLAYGDTEKVAKIYRDKTETADEQPGPEELEELDIQEAQYREALAEADTVQVLLQPKEIAGAYRRAAKCMDEVGDYKDAAALAAEYRERAKKALQDGKEALYARACEKMDGAAQGGVTENVRRKLAIDMFRRLDGYKDALERIKECEHRNAAAQKRGSIRNLLLAACGVALALLGIHFI